MKTKLMFILCLLLVLLSMASVSASDVDHMAIQTSDDTLDDVISSDEVNTQDMVIQTSDDTLDDVISSDEVNTPDMADSNNDAVESNEANAPDSLAVSDENIVLGGDFTDLQRLIDDADGELDLKGSYFRPSYSFRGIDISKNIIINGHGYSIDGNGGGIINICKRGISVTLKDITFANGLSDGGGAILNSYPTSSLTIINCQFLQNSAENLEETGVGGPGGAIYSLGNLTIIDSYFYENKAGKSGGAICCLGHLLVNNTIFSQNTAGEGYFGGAIFCANLRNHFIIDSVFEDNNAYGNDATVGYGQGGAVYCEMGNSHFTNTKFTNNHAGNVGGAIYVDLSKSHLQVSGCTFEDNSAHDGGGAIYTNGEIMIMDSNFTGNSAKLAGAVYASTINQTVNSVFNQNKANSTDGGAIYINNKCGPEFTSCRFEENTAKKVGGAIYLASGDAILKVSDSKFTNNSANEGGAVYAHQITYVTLSIFSNNNATSGCGGAIYINNKCGPEFTSCRFEDNACNKSGGAIYLYSSSSPLKLSDCTFYNNSAKEGGAVCLYNNIEITSSFFSGNSAENAGAIYTRTINKVSESVFLMNKATDDKGNGGAIYINNKCNPEFTSCRFEENTARNIGGAVYLAAKKSHLKLSYCTFVDNHADKKTYSGRNYRSPGHSVFNCGAYDLIDMCWFGNNTPNFSGQLAKYIKKSDEDYKPSNYLRIYIKANDTDLYVGNTYKVTVYFNSTKGKTLQKDLLHSKGTFYGDGEFTIADPNINDMAANVVFTKENGIIYGKIDHQVVTLNDPVKIKDPSEVHILSCDDIQYPDALKVTYEIIRMSNDASYVIKDSRGKIVKQGKLTSPDTLIVNDLAPGSYSITIDNPETQTSLSSSNNTTFSVSKANIDLVVVVFDEVYGDDVECIVYASVDGNYNLTITDGSGLVINSTIVSVSNNFAYYDAGILDAGDYVAKVNFEGNEYYDAVSNSTTFTVYRHGTSFELEINASEITYGETATVTHTISEGATGTIKYYLSNGTFLKELAVDENLTLPILDAGSYVIIANYSGDNDFLPANDSIFLTVKPAPNNAAVSVSNVTFGEESLIVVSADVDGDYVVDVNGTLITVSVNDGVGNKSISLNAGIYYANVTFKNKNYNTTYKNTEFEVYKANTNMELIACDTVYPQYVMGTIYSDVDGVYDLTIGEYITSVTVKDGYGEFNVGVFDAGDYEVVASYSGDMNHKANSSSANVNIAKFVPDMDFSVSDIDYGEVAVIHIICDISGYVNVTVNGITETLALCGEENDLLFSSLLNILRAPYESTLNLHNLGAGTYPVTVVYDGDRNYESVTLTGEFKVNSVNATMDIEASDVSVGEDEKITIKLPSDATGTVTVTIDGKNYTAKVKDGKATISIPNLSAGSKAAEIYYSGDNNYNPASGSASFDVKKVKANMTVDANEPESGEAVHIVVNLPKDATGTVTVTIDGKEYTAPVKDGKAVFDILGLSAGKYDFTAYYSGDDKYDPAQIDSSITVKGNGAEQDNISSIVSKTAGMPTVGNPIMALLLSLMAIGFADIRRFKK